MTAIPGLPGLPGLNLGAQALEALSFPTVTASRQQDLAANTEYRFEVSFSRTLTLKLLSGTAEFYGTELAPSQLYTFTGTKGGVFTWHGCRLEIGGEAESEYVAEETQMMGCANAHFALEALRDRSIQNGDMGPRVLVVGPENAGKTTLVRTLTSYAVKTGRQPIVVNLDPRQGMLSVPGALTAAAFSSIVDVEEGWGTSPISGPSPIPVKMPLVYHYGLKDADEGKLFKPLVTRMALAVTSRCQVDKAIRQSGFIIDSPGAISQGKAGVYENIEHIISEFSGACDTSNSFYAYMLYTPRPILTPRASLVIDNIRIEENQLLTKGNSQYPHHHRLRTPLLRPHPQIRLPPGRRTRAHPPPRQIRRLRRPQRRVHESTSTRPSKSVLLRPFRRIYPRAT
jgi:hypothetical protein